jgi:DNA helicase II / ATP-dependent DNA helicase PcrA
MEGLLSGLNSAQRKAAEHIKGPVMVIAGAGSGKTRVLTYRIAHLLATGTDAFQILALTFTNKAAREMKARIAKVVSADEAKNVWMGTFHSIFARILRVEGSRLGFPSNFTIYDTEDAQKVVANVIKELNLDKEIYKTKSVASRISAYKNNLITPKAYAARADLQEQDASARMPKLGEVYGQYMERCFRAGAMDFDDLLLKTNELFARFPEALAKYQERFRYLLVDEYQDTNHAQYLIVKALASRFENICVVGDDAQSIYSFRGANIRNILNFQNDYPDAALYKLEQSYRSTKRIVSAANTLISHNKEQLQKDVWTENPLGEKIVVHQSVSDSDEGQYVAQTTWDLVHREQHHYSDFAILYRTNAQSRSFEDALRRRNIPYQIYGGLSFYQRKEIKDVLAYVRLTVNASDEEALRRIINLPGRGIGETTLARLTIAANEKKIPIWEAVRHATSWDLGINRPTTERLEAFADLIDSYRIIASQQDAFGTVEHIVRSSGLVKLLAEDKSPEGISRYENIQELLNGIKDFVEQQSQTEDGNPSLGAFLQDVALFTDRDEQESDEPKVTLMTIHLAKGLEFPVVFVVGLEDSLFPSMMAMNSRSDLEEERRLFYVALTRAEQRAYLTHARVRYRWGKLMDCEPSRFLDELDDEHLDVHLPEVAKNYGVPRELRDAFGDPEQPRTFRGGGAFNRSGSASKPAGPPPAPIRFRKPENLKPLGQASAASGIPANELILSPGVRVLHDRFGAGTVTEVESAADGGKATIKFDNAGEKKLLLKFAKLQLLA